ncbi:tryptophan--tRNA ligase, partial [Enterococcus faecalis]
VFSYFDVFGENKEYIEELKDHNRHGGLGDVKIKRYVIDLLEEEHAPIRRRREEQAKNPEGIMVLLHKGSLAGVKVAAQP